MENQNHSGTTLKLNRVPFFKDDKQVFSPICFYGVRIPQILNVVWIIVYLFVCFPLVIAFSVCLRFTTGGSPFSIFNFFLPDCSNL